MPGKIPVNMTPTYGKNIFNFLRDHINKKVITSFKIVFDIYYYIKEKSCKVFKEIVVVKYVGWI